MAPYPDPFTSQICIFLHIFMILAKSAQFFHITAWLYASDFPFKNFCKLWWNLTFLCFIGISIITWVIILKQLFASGSWILVNIPLDFVSGNIHQYSLRLRRIIVKYPIFHLVKHDFEILPLLGENSSDYWRIKNFPEWITNQINKFPWVLQPDIMRSLVAFEMHSWDKQKRTVVNFLKFKTLARLKENLPIHHIHKWRPCGTAWFRMHECEAC